MPPEPLKLDAIDIKILNALQANARISNAELSERVNLSQTPCLRRLRKLEQSGLIQQYSARLDHGMLGINVSAFVFVKLSKNTSSNAAEFESAIELLPEVLDWNNFYKIRFKNNKILWREYLYRRYKI